MNTFKNKKPVIAIDGTASSGKGTLAKRIAKFFNYDYLDTGKLYRSIAFYLIKEKLEIRDFDKLIQKNINILNIKNENLRTREVGTKSSIISKDKKVRKFLLSYQRNFASNPPTGNGSVIDGRDIGSVVIPHAEVKFFIDADLDVRAARRYKELFPLEKEKHESYIKLRKEIFDRDLRDKTRKISPLKKMVDSIFIDTSKLSINETVQLVIKHTQDNLK